MAPEQPSIDSISDFLYVDVERLKIWLAQLDPNGVLLGHSANSAEHRTATDELTGSVGGEAGKNIVIAKAGITGSLGSKQSATRAFLDSRELRFDASWSIPLNVLDLLSENGFIERSLQGADVGSLVVVSGTPHILDLKLMKSIFGPGIDWALSQISQPNRNNPVLKRAKGNILRFSKILDAMPTSTQLNMRTTEGQQIWAPIRDGCLTIDPVDLAMQHGATLKGEWHLLAVVDALPDDDTQQPMNLPAMAYAELMEAAAEVLSTIRGLMGRPTAAFGLTPLLLFRSITRDR